MKYFLIFFCITSARGIFLSCSFQWMSVERTGNQYTCNVIALDFSDNLTHITGYEGTHFPGHSSIDVKTIFSMRTFRSDPNITFLPKGFANFFPNIIAFFIWESEIEKLNGDELEEHPNLQHFMIFQSKFTRVPGNFFASNPNMIYIAMSNNGIEHVGEGLLDNLKSLEQARFGFNVCIDRNAFVPFMVPVLIRALRVQCPDIKKTL